MLLLRQYRQMVYRNSLYHFCSHSVHMKLFQIKILKTISAQTFTTCASYLPLQIISASFTNMK